MRIHIIFFAYILSCTCLFGQATLSGKVQDKNGNPLAFAGVVVQGTSKGTTTNVEGVYAINLPTGSYQIVFQYIGYKMQTLAVQVNAPSTTLNVILESETTELQEIALGAEDPAYGIIRKAQAKRKYYLEEEYKGYRCKAYTKIFEQAELTGGAISLFGATRNIEKGIFYLSETVSELSFEQPNNLQEKVLASKISGDTAGFSYNRANWINFYRNKPFSANGLEFISPIAQNAMEYYVFSLEGSSNENGLLVHKIELIPKNKNSLAFRGFIYITEETSRIHSVEAYVPKGNVPRFDSINIRQIYTPITENPKGVWLSLSLTFYFELSVGKTKGYYHALTSDYELNPVFEPNFFGGKVYEFVDGANRKEENAWQELRPIPLTKAEIDDYQLKTTLQANTAKPAVKDSILEVRNKIRLSQVIFTGIRLENPFTKTSWRFSSFFETINYNTVEGFVVHPFLTYRKTFANYKRLTFSPTLRYGFSNKRFQAKGLVNYLYSPTHFGSFTAEGGRYIAQFNEQNPIFPPINTFYTLFLEDNYMKIYEKGYEKITHQHELFNGFLWTLSGEYARRTPMYNTITEALIPDKDKEFTPNQPANIEASTRDAFVPNTTFVLDAQIQFTPKQKYLLRPQEKIIQGSRLPTFTLRYTRGMIESNFDVLRLQIRDSWDWGVFGDGALTVEGGTFLNNNTIYFQDFQHFSGNRVLALQGGNTPFQLLDYYTFSQTSQYFQAHWKHDFKGWLTNQLAFLKKNQTSLVIGANYLYTDLTGNYVEAGIGINRLFKFLRVDWWNSFNEKGRVTHGIRMSGAF